MKLPQPQDEPGAPPETGPQANGDVAHGDEATAHVPTNFDPRTGRWVSIGAVVSGLLLIIGFAIVQSRKSAARNALENDTAQAAAAPALVDVVHTRYAASTQPLTLPGNTAAWDQSTIYGRVNGYVGNWLVDMGDKVTKGQVLATIQTPDLDAQLAAAQAKFKAAGAQANVEHANAVFAKSTYERWKDSPKGVVSEQEREAKRAEFDSSIAREAAAQAQVNLAQADVDNLMAQTAFKQVTAPYDGVITRRGIDIGNLVTAGSTNNTTSLFVLTKSDPMRVIVNVPQGASDQIQVGMAATVMVDQSPDHTFAGKVARTANAIDPASRTLRVEVDVPNPKSVLIPEMYVNVRFELISKPLVQVPSSALLFRSEGTQIAVINSDSTVHFRTVTIARDQGDVVELGSGAMPGERVALNLSSQITDGAKVNANDIDRPEKPTAAAGGTASAGSAKDN